MPAMKHLTVRLPQDLYAWLLVAADDLECSLGAALRLTLARQRQGELETQALRLTLARQRQGGHGGSSDGPE